MNRLGDVDSLVNHYLASTVPLDTIDQTLSSSSEDLSGGGKRRRRQRKRDSTSEDDQQGNENDAERKKKKRRDQNRVAAQASRERKKQYVGTLEQQIAQLREQQNALQNALRALQEENRSLQARTLELMSCNPPQIVSKEQDLSAPFLSQPAPEILSLPDPLTLPEPCNIPDNSENSSTESLAYVEEPSLSSSMNGATESAVLSSLQSEAPSHGPRQVNSLQVMQVLFFLISLYKSCLHSLSTQVTSIKGSSSPRLQALPLLSRSPHSPRKSVSSPIRWQSLGHPALDKLAAEVYCVGLLMGQIDVRLLLWTHFSFVRSWASLPRARSCTSGT